MFGYHQILLQVLTIAAFCGVVNAQAPVVEPVEEPDRPSIFDGIRRIIGDSPAFDDNDATEGLVESLNHAEKLYEDIRQSNREAIRGINRQVRIGRAKTSPNIILITVPQLRFDQLPAMTRLTGLRTSGMTFTNYYAPAESLAASRWSLMSGQLASTAPQDSQLDRSQSLAEAMWKAGYTTTVIGTWATSQHPIELGYDHWTGFPSSSGVVAKYPEFFFTQSAKAKILNNKNSGQPDSLQMVTNEVNEFLKQHQREPRQFYLHVGLPFIQGSDPQKNIQSVDAALGEIIDSINSLGMGGRVCLMVAGERSHTLSAEIDKPLPVVDKKLSYSKNGLNEGNLRTPLIVFWGNRTPRGSVNDFPCTGIDFFPTLLSLAQAQKRTNGLAGVSLENAFQGKNMRLERLLYWKLEDGSQAARRGRWKVIVPPNKQAIQLFDIESDPEESKNVASEYPDIVQSFIVKSKAKQTSDSEAL
ncbi:sulfatase-like hydrolase/transferase [Planctomicrobium sp.]|nr:sulfatase-like hydrolase/transferase [Planctomicrobium sp.]MDA7527696.1 sulfatase-like hydrolase/transferase [bacterium]MDB4742896.1 sulfatase-like hydrolase/transferase [Planctomicrobium sp.]